MRQRPAFKFFQLPAPGRREVLVSENTFKPRRFHATGAVGDQDRQTDELAIETAHRLYGSQAATAIAFCALDAWFDGEDTEFRDMARLFRRLKN